MDDASGDTPLEQRAESADAPGTTVPAEVEVEVKGEELVLVLEKKKRKRKPPLVPWKKPKDMPRRPLSAYNIFFREQRETMMAKVAAAEKASALAAGESTNAHTTGSAVAGGKVARSRKRSNKSVGIGFANLARTIAANWKDLDDETRAPYEAVAAKEKNRYKEEMLVWRAKQKENKLRAAASEDASTEDQSPASAYPGGALDSSGETSMEQDSQAEPLASALASASASASSPRETPTSFPASVHTPPARPPISMHVGSNIEMESPKKSRRSYQHQGVAAHVAPMEMDFNPIRLSPNIPGRWAEIGSHSYPSISMNMNMNMNMDHNHQQNHAGAAGVHLHQPLHASLSRLDSMQAASNTSMPMGFGIHTTGSEPGMVGMPNFNPNASDSALAMNRMNSFAFSSGTQTGSPPQMFQQQEERHLMWQQQRLFQQQQQIQLQHQQQQQQLLRLQEQGMMLANHDQHHPATRRNTWSGGSQTHTHTQHPTNTHAGGDDDDRIEPGMMRNAHRGSGGTRASFTSPPSVSGHIMPSSIPESWFEPEAESTPAAVVGPPRASKLYPDTWFEVAEDEMRSAPQETLDDESMRYSPDGDLNGKVSATSSRAGLRKNASSSTSMFHKPGSTSSGERKIDEQFRPPMRTLEDIAGGGGSSGSFPASTGPLWETTTTTTTTTIQQKQAQKSNISPETFVGNSAFQALGMQFDDDTMDFLARLRQESILMEDPAANQRNKHD